MTPAAEATPRWFRCTTAARWLPRSLAGCLLTVALLISLDGSAERAGPASGRIVVLAGALGALWIVRQGAELRVEVALVAGAVVLGRGERGTRLDFERIDSIDYAPLFSSVARPLPAALLIDRQGSALRLPALLEHGDRLVEQLVLSAGRDDLVAWVAARRVAPRMRRAELLVTAGYLVCASTLVVCVFAFLR